jgi:hypothetical protein
MWYYNIDFEKGIFMNKNNKILKIIISIIGLIIALFLLINVIKTINYLKDFDNKDLAYNIIEICLESLLCISLLYFCTLSILTIIKEEYKKTLPYASLSIFIYILLSNALNLIFYFKSTWSYTYIFICLGLVCFILNTIYIFRKFDKLFNFLIISILGLTTSILMIIAFDGVINYLLNSSLVLFYLGLSINTILLIKKGV